jgi:outer membrane lipoprotein-sorting protein
VKRIAILIVLSFAFIGCSKKSAIEKDAAQIEGTMKKMASQVQTLAKDVGKVVEDSSKKLSKNVIKALSDEKGK